MTSNEDAEIRKHVYKPLKRRSPTPLYYPLVGATGGDPRVGDGSTSRIRSRPPRRSLVSGPVGATRRTTAERVESTYCRGSSSVGGTQKSRLVATTLKLESVRVASRLDAPGPGSCLPPGRGGSALRRALRVPRDVRQSPRRERRRSWFRGCSMVLAYGQVFTLEASEARAPHTPQITIPCIRARDSLLQSTEAAHTATV